MPLFRRTVLSAFLPPPPPNCISRFAPILLPHPKKNNAITFFARTTPAEFPEASVSPEFMLSLLLPINFFRTKRENWSYRKLPEEAPNLHPNRPDVLRKEGNTLYFHWPRLQLEAYFRRFGKEAVILEPDECRESMRFFYKKAWEAYRKKEKSV